MNLNQITVPSINVPQSIIFYQQLGLRLIVHTHDAYARFECPDGTSTFSIHAVDQLPTGSGIMVYFECEDLDAQVAHLIEKGIVFYELPNDKSWLWREAHLNDPDGNHLILYYAGDNRKNPPWRDAVFG
jgi:catechol 2,3-dioxygenase-like lactoylglutathione lyase family enzyme